MRCRATSTVVLLLGALELFERIVETDSWAAFGYVAAEAELARRRR